MRTSPVQSGSTRATRDPEGFLATLESLREGCRWRRERWRFQPIAVLAETQERVCWNAEWRPLSLSKCPGQEGGDLM